MQAISHSEAMQYVQSLPQISETEASFFPDLTPNEQHVLRIAVDLFARLQIKNPKSFLDGIFITGKKHKQRDLSILEPLLNHPKKVLDAGCGWGGLSRLLLDAGQAVFACDYVLDHAYATKLLCPEATVFCTNAMTLPIPSGSVDLSILMGVIEHVGSVDVPRGRSGRNALLQYRLVREMSRVTAMNGHLFLNTGNALFPRDGETDSWFYHWLPAQEQQRYNELVSISADNYWLLTWEELSLILSLCGFEISSVHSPDTDCWNDRFVDRLDLCFSELNPAMISILKELIRENPHYFSSWNLFAQKTRMSTPLDVIDFAAISPSTNYLPYHLLLEHHQRGVVPNRTPDSLHELYDYIGERALWAWGTGAGGKKAHQRLGEAGITVAGFIDSAESKRGSLFLDLPVLSPIDLSNLTDRPYVFIASVYKHEIEMQLKKFGYRYIFDYFSLFELSS